MAERSGFWTNGSGDGHPYSQDEFRTFLKWIHRNPAANEGLYHGQLNELEVTSPGNNQINVDSGRALVDGMFYEHDDDQTLAVSSPTTGTTGKRVVLRKSWSDRTVRIAIISSADGTPSLPALTQTDGATWEIPLASFTITTGGVIGSLTDEREWLPDALGDLHGVDTSGALAGHGLLFNGSTWETGSATPPYFGDGSDGDVTISGATTLTRDMYYENLTINASQTLSTGGYRIFVRDTLTINSGAAIQNSAPGNGNTAAPSGTVGGGATGGTQSTLQGGGGGGVVMVAARNITGTGTIRANGGTGSSTTGTTSASAPGSASATPPAASAGGSRHITTNPAAFVLARTLDGNLISGGAGGSGWVSSNAPIGTAATNSLGGAGGNVSSGGGGTGGGGGGVVLLLTTQADHDLTLQANGGAGRGTGQAGSAGTTLTMVI